MQGLLAKEKGGSGSEETYGGYEPVFHSVSGFKQALFQLEKITSGYLDGNWRS